MHAVAKGAKSVVRLLLRSGANIAATTSQPQRSGLTVLHVAAEAGAADLVPLLIQARSSLQAGHEQPCLSCAHCA